MGFVDAVKDFVGFGDVDYEDESMQEYFEEEFIEELPEDDEDFDLEEED